jgi:hypothetical protein
MEPFTLQHDSQVETVANPLQDIVEKSVPLKKGLKRAKTAILEKKVTTFQTPRMEL